MKCLYYHTDRLVIIPSWYLGITYKIVVFLILGFYGFFVVWYHGKYQLAVPVQSVVVTKVRGSAHVNYNDGDFDIPLPHSHMYKGVWDAPDIVIPADGGEDGEFFIMTNLVITPNQTLGVCPEDPYFPSAQCNDSTDCENGMPIINGNGIMTGNCVPAGKTMILSTNKTCEIQGWCPVDPIFPLNSSVALLESTKDLTVQVKNSIRFPAFGPSYHRRNILDDATTEYLLTCINNETDPYCPTFRIGDIVERAGFEYKQVAVRGGVFAIIIKWSCSFDFGDTINECLPTYSFARIDDKDAKTFSGFNFRTVKYLDEDENRRTHTKHYGIKFVIEVAGEGRKLNFGCIIVHMGAGLGYIGGACLFCDFCLKCCTK